MPRTKDKTEVLSTAIIKDTDVGKPVHDIGNNYYYHFLAAHIVDL